MDQASLKHAALTLDLILQRYAEEDPGGTILHSALSDLLQAAILGQLQHPLAWNDIPGDYLVNETSMRQYPDLESAYANFKIEATGGETPALKAMRARTNASKTDVPS
ncbi:hypothetical protein [Granulicella arctica]|uniref:hypothetical protein n=1 Tax=Granulicella arctica TaxID=940613 RepID=UPI0021E04603|nr:hypothetical protein [Granulicella arctica]